MYTTEAHPVWIMSAVPQGPGPAFHRALSRSIRRRSSGTKFDIASKVRLDPQFLEPHPSENVPRHARRYGLESACSLRGKNGVMELGRLVSHAAIIVVPDGGRHTISPLHVLVLSLLRLSRPADPRWSYTIHRTASKPRASVLDAPSRGSQYRMRGRCRRQLTSCSRYWRSRPPFGAVP